MNKTKLVRARIEPDIKNKAEAILRPLGIGHSAFITMSYQAIVEAGGIPGFMMPNGTKSNTASHEIDNLESDVEDTNTDVIENFMANLAQTSETGKS